MELDVHDLRLAGPPAAPLLALDTLGLVTVALVRGDDVGRRPDLAQRSLVDPRHV